MNRANAQRTRTPGTAKGILPASPGTIALISALWLLPSVLFAADPTLRVTLNRSDIFVGESIIAHVTVNGTTDVSAPDLSRVTDCDLSMLAQRNNSRRTVISIQNRAHVESVIEYEFVYEVRPHNPGPFTMGPVTVIAGKRRLTATAKPVTVKPIEKQDLVQIDVTTSQSKVLVDETFEVAMKIRLKRLPAPHENVDPLIPRHPPHVQAPYINQRGIEGFSGPEPNLMDYLKQHLAPRLSGGMYLNDFKVNTSPFGISGFLDDREPAKLAFDRRSVEVNGIQYLEYSVNLRYTARELGDYVFGPVTFKGEVATKVDPYGRAATSPIYAVGPAANLRVVPPPEAGRPESYIGLISSNLQVTTQLDVQTCSVGDPLTLRVEVRSDGRLENAHLLALGSQKNLESRFRVYEDTAQLQRGKDSLVYIFTLRPLIDGTFELPPVEVSFFNSRDREYRTVFSGPIPIRVNPAIQIHAGDLIGSITNREQAAQAEANAAAELLAPIDADPRGAYAAETTPGSTIAGIAATGPGIFACLLLARVVRRRAIQRSPVRMRRAAFDAATAACRQAMRKGLSHHAEHRKNLLEATSAYLGVLAGRESAALTPTDVPTILDRLSVPPDTTAELASILQRLFDATYALEPGASIADDARRVLDCLHTIHGATKSRQILTAPAILGAGLLLLASPATGTARLESSQTFLWNQANRALASATDSGDYFRAANIYQRLASKNIRNGPLFYNLGTALLGAGEYDAAIAALQRAECHMGSNADVRHNLRLALRKKRAEPGTSLPWYRLLLAWHYHVSLDTRIMITVFSFSAFWFFSALALVRFPAWRPLCAVACLVFAMFGTSALASVQAEADAKHAGPGWVTAPAASDSNEAASP